METKICLRCGKEYMTARENQKYCSECKVEHQNQYYKQWYLKNREKRLKQSKEEYEYDKEHGNPYYFANKEKIKKYAKQQRKAYSIQYNKDHKEEIKQWREDHKEELAEYYKQYHLAHKEKKQEYARRYFKTPIGKVTASKTAAKRKRNLGYISLNKWFEGCAGHHINYKYVIYIPERMHKSINHRLKTQRGMIEINTLAIQYLIDNG